MPAALQATPTLSPPSPSPAVSDELLSGITQRIVDCADPFAVILFGSYAWGRPHTDSDIDLLVVTPPLTGLPDNVSEIRSAASVRGLPMDVIVYTPEQVATRIAMDDFFILRILGKGRRLYERSRPWETLEGHPTMTLLEEWIAKAEADYEMAVDLNRRRRNPVPDGVSFHCQQCAEKYLKALLIKRGGTPEKTHDLRDLLRDCAKLEPSLLALMPEAELLNKLSVDPRYPGFYATVEQASDAVAAMRSVRKAVRKLVV